MNKVAYGVITIVLAALAFFGGVQYQKGQKPSFDVGRFAAGNFPAGMMGNGPAGAAGAARRVGAGRGGATGTVLSVDAQSLTMKLADGSSQIVYLPTTATYFTEQAATVADVKTGATVTIAGTPNQDGSTNAATVRVQPAS